MEERIIELELRFTEQQAALQDLSDVVFSQSKVIDQLKAELEQLRGKISEPGLVDAAQNERPPHY